MGEVAWLNVHFYSFALGQTCGMDVLLPEADAGIGVTEQVWDGLMPLPVLYLLHGHSDDHTVWMRRTALERHFAGRRLAIVIPAANRSFFCDQKCGYAYSTFLSEELPKICQRFFRISGKQEDTFIAGLSMGGYGAMRAALTFPQRYGAVASMSGGLDLLALPPALAFDDETTHSEEAMKRLKLRDPTRFYVLMDLKMTFGSRAEFQGSDNDLCALLKRRIQLSDHLPAMHISMGTEDFLRPTNQRFLEILNAHGIAYHYVQPRGAHEWSVWDRMISQVLDWIAPKIGERG